MNIALLAFDLDGTTITQHQYLPQENRLALEDAAAQGILLVPASGRMKDFLPREITALPGVRYAITANGAGVYDLATGEAVWQRLIPNEKARQVQAVLEEYDLFVEYYSQGKATTRQGDPERAFTHFGLPESKRHFLDKYYCLVPAWQRLEALGGLVLTSSIPDNIEVNAQGADKGSALRALAERLGIPREKVMALGDNGNDVTMLQYAGVSVAMGDGSPEAKAAARFLTAPHDQNGLAQAVRQYVLS